MLALAWQGKRRELRIFLQTKAVSTATGTCDAHAWLKQKSALHSSSDSSVLCEADDANHELCRLQNDSSLPDAWMFVSARMRGHGIVACAVELGDSSGLDMIPP